MFSIIFRDRELEFIKKTIPSAIKLNPGELLFGIDKGAKLESISVLKNICKENNFDRYTIVEVEKSDDWKFQLAKVTWDCYKQAKFDKILYCDVDNDLNSKIMLGYDQIGKDDLALVTFLKKLPMNSISDFIRYITYRLDIARRSFAPTGLYWIYRPYFFDNVTLDDYKKIHNGIDIYLMDKILKRRKHKIITHKIIGAKCFDIQSNDYPWRQFQSGVWYGANKHRLLEYITEEHKKTHSKLSLATRIIYSHPMLIALIKYLFYQHPYFLKGYRWACKNHDHEAVVISSKNSLREWEEFGGKYLKNLGEWKRHGTGFT